MTGFLFYAEPAKKACFPEQVSNKIKKHGSVYFIFAGTPFRDHDPAESGRVIPRVTRQDLIWDCSHPFRDHNPAESGRVIPRVTRQDLIWDCSHPFRDHDPAESGRVIPRVTRQDLIWDCSHPFRDHDPAESGRVIPLSPQTKLLLQPFILCKVDSPYLRGDMFLEKP